MGSGAHGQLGYSKDQNLGDTGSLALLGDVPLTPISSPLPRQFVWYRAGALLALGAFERRRRPLSVVVPR